MTVLVLLLVIGGGFYFYKMRQNTPAKIEVMKQEEKTENNGDDKVVDAKKKSYSMDEVVKHNNASDCWMAVNGKVYDATSFVGNHPGGPAILKGCGTDATKLFEERPTNNKGPHPEQAREQLAKLYIGELSK